MTAPQRAEIIVEVNGQRVPAQVAGVKSAIATIGPQVQDTSKTAVAGFEDMFASIGSMKDQLAQLKQPLAGVSTSTRTATQNVASLGLGFVAGQLAIEAAAFAVNKFIESQAGLTSTTQAALKISNEVLRTRQESIRAIEEQIQATEAYSGAVSKNVEQLTANLVAHRQLAAFDLATRIKGTAEALETQNNNLARFVSLSAQLKAFITFRAPKGESDPNGVFSLATILAQLGLLEAAQFAAGKAQEYFGEKTDDATLAMQKLAVDTIPFLIQSGKTLDQSIAEITEKFHLAPKEVDHFRQALEQLGGVAQLSLPQKLKTLQESLAFESLRRRNPALADPFKGLFTPAQQARNDALATAREAAGRKDPLDETKANVLKMLGLMETTQKKVVDHRLQIDEQIASLNRKALTGLAAEFDTIEQGLRRILGRVSESGLSSPIKQQLTQKAQAAAAAARMAAVEREEQEVLKIRADASNKEFDLALKGIGSINARIREDTKRTKQAQGEIDQLGIEGRLALATRESERLAIENEKQLQDFKLKYAGIDHLAEKSDEFRAGLAALSEARLKRQREDIAQSLQDDIAQLEAEVAAFRPGHPEQSGLARLQGQQQKERRHATNKGLADLGDLERKHALEITRFQQEQYDKLYDNVRDHAGNVFDAMLLKGQSVFKSLADYMKAAFLSAFRKIFADSVAELFTPMFARAQAVGGAGAPARAGGGFGGLFNLGGLFGGGSQGGGLFGGGGGGGPLSIGTPPFFPSNSSPLGQGGTSGGV